jgi:glycosyltransferase involved in cell wall biosynthesis
MPPVARWVDPYGVPVRLFGGRWPGAWRDRAFALGVAWVLLAGRRRYQFVYFLMQGLHLAVGLPVARLLGKPVIMKFSGSNVVSLVFRSWLGRWELRRLRQWARRIMILNPGMEQEAIQAGLSPQQLLWMPNPVDIKVFAPLRVELRAGLRASRGVPQDALVALYVGRLAPEKELPSLIRAFARTAGQLPGAKLVLVGDGPERDALAALAAALGLGPTVVFTGSLPAADVLPWLQLSDAFVLVSSLEGFSCSLLEAMATALPSVVSDIPANRQLIQHEFHGLLVGLRDEAAIGGALARLLADPSLRLRLGSAARASVAANYSIEKVADRYEALFQEILG